jgi:hypothetical protein
VWANISEPACAIGAADMGNTNAPHPRSSKEDGVKYMDQMVLHEERT